MRYSIDTSDLPLGFKAELLTKLLQALELPRRNTATRLAARYWIIEDSRYTRRFFGTASTDGMPIDRVIILKHSRPVPTALQVDYSNVPF